jgi:hypothetical protein
VCVYRREGQQALVAELRRGHGEYADAALYAQRELLLGEYLLLCNSALMMSDSEHASGSRTSLLTYGVSYRTQRANDAIEEMEAARPPSDRRGTMVRTTRTMLYKMDERDKESKEETEARATMLASTAAATAEDDADADPAAATTCPLPPIETGLARSRCHCWLDPEQANGLLNGMPPAMIDAAEVARCVDLNPARQGMPRFVHTKGSPPSAYVGGTEAAAKTAAKRAIVKQNATLKMEATPASPPSRMRQTVREVAR